MNKSGRHLERSFFLCEKGCRIADSVFLCLENHVSKVNKAAPVIVSVCSFNSCVCLFMYEHVNLREGAVIHKSGSAVSFEWASWRSHRELRDIRMFEHWKNKHTHKHAHSQHEHAERVSA